MEFIREVLEFAVVSFAMFVLPTHTGIMTEFYVGLTDPNAGILNMKDILFLQNMKIDAPTALMLMVTGFIASITIPIIFSEVFKRQILLKYFILAGIIYDTSIYFIPIVKYIWE